jgi:AMP nucleosidase
VRVDYSLKRLQHYTGTSWRAVQPWILLTNYHRYVDQFVKWGIGQLGTGSAYSARPAGRRQDHPRHDPRAKPRRLPSAPNPSGTASRCQPIT